MARKFKQKIKSEFDQKLIELRRVTRVVKGGKRLRFRAAVLLGNKKGLIGFGIAKAKDTTAAIEKAAGRAKKHAVKVPIVNDTIPHRVDAKYNSGKVLIKPAPKGTGVIAGGAVRDVAELAGIKNLTGKMLGSQNKINNILATFEALKKLRTKEAILKSRGKKIIPEKEKTKESLKK